MATSIAKSVSFREANYEHSLENIVIPLLEAINGLGHDAASYFTSYEALDLRMKDLK